MTPLSSNTESLNSNEDIPAIVNLNLEGDVALVAASSSGLGKAAATSLAKEGADVVINGRDVDRLEKTRTEIDAVSEGTVFAQSADLTKADDIEMLVRNTVDEFGTLDHLVTSSGGPPSGQFLQTTDDEWYEAFDLLVMSVVRLVRAAASPLQAQEGGTITFITSRSVKEAMDSLVLSNAVRMGVIGLEKTLSKELAPAVRANAVIPGSHVTSRVRNLVEQAVDRGEHESFEEGMTSRSEDVPLGRLGDPEELGDIITFLCSDRASYINGVALPVDGGSLKSNL
jgi:3-oxoacyl-[acyl-carrier protein] reductase